MDFISRYINFNRFRSYIFRSMGLPPSYSPRLRYGSIRTIEKFLANSGIEERKCDVTTRSLDLGCGNNPRNPFGATEVFGIDIQENLPKNIIKSDLFSDLIPFDDGFFDYVTAYDFLEHVPRVDLNGGTRFPFIDLMNEVHRVLKKGGMFFSKTPAFPFKESFQDPTHVNIITEDTFFVYFCDNSFHPLAVQYGFKGSFKLISQKWWGDAWLLILIEKRGF